MLSFYEKDGFLYTHQTGHPDHVFEIVDEVPLGYLIWNIGKNMPDGYLPLCRIKDGREFDIEPETLEAIRHPEAQTILAGAGCAGTLKEMEAFVKKYKNDKRESYWVKRIEEALPYARQLKWH